MYKEERGEEVFGPKRRFLLSQRGALKSTILRGVALKGLV